MRPRGARGARPLNQWQRATALGRRLHVSVRLGKAIWTHPDHPGVHYAVHEVGRWSLEVDGAAVAGDAMDVNAAALYIDTARNAEPRRLAAWQMLQWLDAQP